MHASTIRIADVIFLASATRQTDPGAYRIEIVAGGIATFAFAIFFVITANAGWFGKRFCHDWSWH